MVSDKRRVLNYLLRKEPEPGFFDFQEILREAVASSLDKTGTDIDRYVQSRLKSYWNDIKVLNQEDMKRGIKPQFIIEDEISKKVSYYLSQERLSLPLKKAILLRSRTSILKKIDSLNPRKYEALSCLIMQLLGARDVLLTASGNEAGIDSLCAIKFGEGSHYLFGANGPVRVICQCKKYSTPVQVKEIKEFNSTLDDIHHLTEKVRDILPDWFRASKGPIIGWFISHSGFQSGATDRAKNHGIVLSDSRDLAEIIAGCRKFANGKSNSERARVLMDRVQKILASSIINPEQN